MFEINEGYYDQNADKQKNHERKGCHPEALKDDERKKRSQHLDEGIKKRDEFATVPALAPKQKKTEHGDVVVDADRVAALRAAGSWVDDRNPLRNAAYANIEKASDGGARQNNKNRKPPSPDKIHNCQSLDGRISQCKNARTCEFESFY